MESCQNLTPLSHLIVCWSNHSRFFPLFAIKGDDGNSLLSYFYDILDQNVVGGEVEKHIMMVSLSLLTRSNYEEDGDNGAVLTAGLRYDVYYVHTCVCDFENLMYLLFRIDLNFLASIACVRYAMHYRCFLNWNHFRLFQNFFLMFSLLLNSFSLTFFYFSPGSTAVKASVCN